MHDQRQLFDFMQERVKEISVEDGLKPPQAFAKWFAKTYFLNPQKYFPSDGSGDGKVDSFFEVSDGNAVLHFLLNTKFTEKYDTLAPPSFYDEITRFWQAFANKANRQAYLSVVRSELRQRYQKMFTYYDEERAQLLFVTNHRRNEKQYESVKAFGVKIFHLNDLLQFVVDYIEDAMPRTPTLKLTGINTILSVDKRDTNVPTSIVFAKLIDLIRYMQDDDPYDLLFARNIRLKLLRSKVNPEIAATFRDEPAEFVFSNNGITMLCERHSHDSGTQEVVIENPRVVNGSQTLHSIRDVLTPSTTARVMIRIIRVPPPSAVDFSSDAAKRREIIEKISVRSNLQNPIKKWNLISNDDYQHTLARFFRKKRMYYERRDGEWSLRRTELRSVGINRGPHIKHLTQLVASYHWDKKYLGPAAARRGVGALFEDKPYDAIRKTTPELSYQVYLLDDILDDCIRQLSASRQYIEEFGTYLRLVLFSHCIRNLQAAGVKFGDSHVTAALERGSAPMGKWCAFCKNSVDTLRTIYKQEAKKYRKETGRQLTVANFAKNAEYVNRVLQGPIPQHSRALSQSRLSKFGQGRKWKFCSPAALRWL
jgi:hypothetical protein